MLSPASQLLGCSTSTAKHLIFCVPSLNSILLRSHPLISYGNFGPPTQAPLGSIEDAQLWDLSGSGHAMRLAPMPGRSESNVLLVQGERHLQGQSPKWVFVCVCVCVCMAACIWLCVQNEDAPNMTDDISAGLCRRAR